MKLKTLARLEDIDAFADHGFVFDAHSRDRSEVIKRYRGTVVTADEQGVKIAAWQKSIYHFGGLNREVPIFITLTTDPDGFITAVKIDERSNGSQGKRCSFPCLEGCINSKLSGKRIADIPTLFPSSSETKCLHIYEILAAAASFCAHLEALGLANGAEQELFSAVPTADGLIVNSKHEILGKTSETELLFTHNTMPELNEFNLPVKLDSRVLVRFNGSAARREELSSDSFELCYAQLNRLATRCYNLEKKFFGLSGRVKFSNCPSMSGLIILATSHQMLSGTVSRALKVEQILHYLQTGYNKNPCKGFGG